MIKNPPKLQSNRFQHHATYISEGFDQIEFTSGVPRYESTASLESVSIPLNMLLATAKATGTYRGPRAHSAVFDFQDQGSLLWREPGHGAAGVAGDEIRGVERVNK